MIAMTSAWCEELALGFFCLGEGEFGRDSDVGAQFGIELGDAREHETDEFDGGEFAFAEESRDFFDGGEGEIGVGHWGAWEVV